MRKPEDPEEVTATYEATYQVTMFGPRVIFDMPEGKTSIDSATLNGETLSAVDFDYGVDGTQGIVNVNSKDDEVKVVIGGVEYTLVF